MKWCLFEELTVYCKNNGMWLLRLDHKDVVLLYSLIDSSCWGTSNHVLMMLDAACGEEPEGCSQQPAQGEWAYFRNRSSKSNQAFRCLQTWQTSWLQPHKRPEVRTNQVSHSWVLGPLEIMRSGYMFIVLSHYILEWFVFVVLDNKYKFLWYFRVYLVFVCLFLFFAGGNLVKCFKVLRHIGMIHDENIRKRTARPSSEWLKIKGAKRWGRRFSKKPAAYYLKSNGKFKIDANSIPSWSWGQECLK